MNRIGPNDRSRALQTRDYRGVPDQLLSDQDGPSTAQGIADPAVLQSEAYSQGRSTLWGLGQRVELTGFEPVTYWLQTSRSNQLSYSPAGASLRARGAESALRPAPQCVPTAARIT